MNQFKDFGISIEAPFSGDKIKITKVLNRPIIVKNYKVDESKYERSNNDKCLCLQIEIDNENHILFSGSRILISQILKVDKSNLPFTATIVKEGEHFEFR